MPIYALTPRRSMHYQPFAPVLTRHPSHSPCAPRSQSLIPSLFRGLESDFASIDTLFNTFSFPPQALRSFQPRFDVREESDAFHLTGEVPGVDARNLQVEFVDRNTLVVRGRTVRESQHGDAPAAALENAGAGQDKGRQKAVADTEAETAVAQDAVETGPSSRPATPASGSSNYHRATVEDSREDGDDFIDVAAEDSASAEQQQQQTTSTEAAKTTESAGAAREAEQQPQQQTRSPKEDGHYWVSERSLGSFQRSFRFPGQVDQEGVKANLKDGVLSVVVPKARESGPKRIVVE